MTSGYVCTSCGAACAADTHEPKCRCGGLFELDFTPPAWDPARIDRSEWSIFRYRDFMAVDGDIWRSVTMGEGMTPVIEMDGRNGVLLKMDYAMPTLSFKDRGAATLVSHMLAIGVRTCVQDSSGNAGNSVAAYAARAGIACEIYVPEGTSPSPTAPRCTWCRARATTARTSAARRWPNAARTTPTTSTTRTSTKASITPA